MNPTTSQQRAINTKSQTVLLVAGAGSGKTATVIARIEKLLREGVRPDGILCLTFTRKAALEMYDRLTTKVRDQAKKVWIGTFHAISYRILMEWGEKIGYQTTAGRSITVVTPEESEYLFSDIMKSYNYKGTKKSISEARKVLAHDGIQPDNFDIRRIIAEYHSRLKECNAVDFDLLLLEVQRLFQVDPRSMEYYRNKFAYIFVDEYQDTDRVQYNLHELLRPKHLFCVGDPDQAIYGWRGASVEIILNFEKEHPGAEVIKLEECFRCGEPIVKAANRLIEHNQNRLEKTLIPTIPEGSAAVCVDYSPHTNVDRLELWALKYSDDQCAVIARTHKILEELEKECLESGLPVSRVGKKTSQVEADPSFKFFCAMVRLDLNPRDNIAFLTANETWKADLQEIWRIANLRGCSWYEAWDNYHKTEPFTSPEKLFLGLDVCKAYQTACELAEIEPVQTICDYLFKTWPDTLTEDWLKSYQLRDSQLELEIGKPDAITLITAHAAKGLEWENVMIVGFDQNVFPSNRAVREGNIEEERRLAYVAFTRAKKNLVIAYKDQPSVFIVEAGLT